MSEPSDLVLGSKISYQFLNATKNRAYVGDYLFCGETLTSAGTGYASHLETERYIDAIESDMTIYFEANMKAGSGGTIAAQLYSLSDTAAVSDSEISSTSDSAFERKRSAAIALTKGKRYCVQTKHVTAAGSVAMARLIIT